MSDPTVVTTDLHMAVLIFLDGVTTGIATALANFASTIPVEHRDLMTEEILRSMTEDPLAMEQLRTEVRDRLLGRPDPGPFNFKACGGAR